jgi:hypothetical protein
MPLCFVAAIEFQKECSTIDIKGVMEAMNRERECESFTPWKQGYTPREHHEMLEMKLLRDWQANREEADRAWRERQAREDRQWREKESALARGANRIHLWEIVVVSAISVVIAVAAIIAQVHTTRMQIEAQRQQNSAATKRPDTNPQPSKLQD